MRYERLCGNCSYVISVPKKFYFNMNAHIDPVFDHVPRRVEGFLKAFYHGDGSFLFPGQESELPNLPSTLPLREWPPLISNLSVCLFFSARLGQSGARLLLRNQLYYSHPTGRLRTLSPRRPRRQATRNHWHISLGRALSMGARNLGSSARNARAHAEGLRQSVQTTSQNLRMYQMYYCILL